MAGNRTKDAPAVEASDEARAAFRETLHRLIERVGFPHEGDVIAARNAVDDYLGYELVVPPYTGPLYDANTGAYIGPGEDPNTADTSSDVAVLA